MDPDVDVPDATMYELFRQAADRWPGNTALIYLGRRISYAEMLDEVDRCAAASPPTASARATR